MKQVQYVGSSDVRSLDKGDFEKLGIERNKTTWTGTETQELSDKDADALAEALPKEFKVVEEAPATSDSTPQGKSKK